jgi:hypothetical protein
MGSLIGLGLFVFLALQIVSWLTELHAAYQPGSSSSLPSSGVLLFGALCVLPFSFHSIVLIFASRFGEGGYWTNLARGLGLSSFAYLSQVIAILGLSGVGFWLVHKVPAVLLGLSVCALAHWLASRARVNDDGTRIVNAMAWIVILWSVVGYISVIVSLF